ncbi:uncharacterized protein LOC135378695 isoform X2 [Ornithodoros turicata]|uniref:uncharacterized protein LOC135378695 isoform X2 n=1 Tax=Ornithodoros turicata TaxID=34597 RepID=UPI003139FCCA
MFTSAAFNPVIYRPVMHAYVCYVQDDVRAIVPVSLIRNSRPPSETDYDSSHRMVYWCSTKGDGSDEEYYQAEILDLAGSKAAMILKIKSQKLPIPRIFHCSKDYHPASDKKKSGSDTRKAKESAKKQRLRDMASCSVQGGRAVKKGYGKRNRSCSGDDSTSSDESVVPQHLLVEKDATIARLRKRLREKQEKTSRLTLALLDKIEVARQVAAEAAPQPAWPLDARQTFAPPHESRAEVSQNICPQDVSLHEDVVQHALVSGYFLISQTSSCFTDKECLGLQDDSDALPIITVDQGTACPVDSTRAPPMFTGSSASTSGALARPACTVQPGEMRPSPTRELQLEQIQYEMYSVVDSKVITLASALESCYSYQQFQPARFDDIAGYAEPLCEAKLQTAAYVHHCDELRYFMTSVITLASALESCYSYLQFQPARLDAIAGYAEPLCEAKLQTAAYAHHCDELRYFMTSVTTAAPQTLLTETGQELFSGHSGTTRIVSLKFPIIFIQVITLASALESCYSYLQFQPARLDAIAGYAEPLCEAKLQTAAYAHHCDELRYFMTSVTTAAPQTLLTETGQELFSGHSGTTRIVSLKFPIIFIQVITLASALESCYSYLQFQPARLDAIAGYAEPLCEAKLQTAAYAHHCDELRYFMTSVTTAAPQTMLTARPARNFSVGIVARHGSCRSNFLSFLFRSHFSRHFLFAWGMGILSPWISSPTSSVAPPTRS